METKLTTIAEAMEVLVTFIPNNTDMTKENYKLERIQGLLDVLGNPQNSFRSIHIAGTSGKTSTAYFIRGLLEQAGVRTGLTVSPHIDSVTERIQIGGKPIADELFLDYLTSLLNTIETSGIRPTYYELLICLAYMVFSKEEVEYVVVETGMGGLMDGTNTITRADKMCVITDIGLDHTHILGHTHAEIAAHKAGIVQPGNMLLVQSQDPDVEKVISDIATTRGASGIEFIPESVSELSQVLPKFQQRNWSLAVATYERIAKRDGLPDLDKLDLSEIEMMQPLGRMDVLKIGDKTLILDGAHNPQKIRALAESLAEKGYKQLPILANLVPAPEDKTEDSLGELHAISDTLIIPDFAITRDVGRSLSPGADMLEMVQRAGFESVTVIPDLDQALTALLARSEPVLLVTGSLYLVSQVRALLRK